VKQASFSCHSKIQGSSRERESLTLEHGAHHHEPLEKQGPLTPSSHLHRPNQFFSQPSGFVENQTQLTQDIH